MADIIWQRAAFPPHSRCCLQWAGTCFASIMPLSMEGIFGPFTNAPLFMGGVWSQFNSSLCAHTSLPTKQHLDWLSRFCTAHLCAQCSRIFMQTLKHSVHLCLCMMCLFAVSVDKLYFRTMDKSQKSVKECYHFYDYHIV